MTQYKHLQDYIYPQIKSRVSENNMDERYVDLIQERLDNDEYLWDHIKDTINYAIDHYAIEAESDYEKQTK